MTDSDVKQWNKRITAKNYSKFLEDYRNSIEEELLRMIQLVNDKCEEMDALTEEIKRERVFEIVAASQ